MVYVVGMVNEGLIVKIFGCLVWFDVNGIVLMKWCFLEGDFVIWFFEKLVNVGFK